MEKDKNSEFIKKMVPALVMILVAFLIILILAFSGVGQKKAEEDTVSISGIWLSIIENTGNAEDTESDDGSAGLNSVRTYSRYFSWKDDGSGEYYATKRIQFQNVEAEGSTSAYVRAAIKPSWSITVDEENGSSEAIMDDDSLAQYDLAGLGELLDLVFLDDNGYEVSDWREASAYQMGDIIFELADGWSEGWIYNDEDGYFYYKAIVDPGMATTTLLLESVKISGETYEIMQEHDIVLEVDVLADAVSTQSGALEEAWGTASDLGITVRSNGNLGTY